MWPKYAKLVVEIVYAHEGIFLLPRKWLIGSSTSSICTLQPKTIANWLRCTLLKENKSCRNTKIYSNVCNIDTWRMSTTPISDVVRRQTSPQILRRRRRWRRQGKPRKLKWERNSQTFSANFKTLPQIAERTKDERIPVL